ncbi:MAG: hypothetical protein QW577_03120 [Candidatus Bathyarchaeia archaeon]
MGVSFQLQSISLKRSEFDLKGRLMKPSLLPWAPVEVDSSLALPAIAEAAPLAHDVVEWMHKATADMAVFDAMCEDYNRLGSQLVSSSGDAYIPGVKVGDIRGQSLDGGTVRARGYGTVITPAGSFNVPVKGKATFAKGDILAWAALPDPGTGVQWVLTLLQWLELAVAPISERVRFAGSGGLVAPNFFSIPSTLAPVRTLRIGLTSDKPQTVAIRGRGAKGAFESVIFEDSFDIDAGESEVIYNVFAVPFVSAFTLELQPSDNTQTVLDYIEIIPPL